MKFAADAEDIAKDATKSAAKMPAMKLLRDSMRLLYHLVVYDLGYIRDRLREVVEIRAFRHDTEKIRLVRIIDDAAIVKLSPCHLAVLYVRPFTELMRHPRSFRDPGYYAVFERRLRQEVECALRYVSR